jgi:hypothetical protein
LLALRANQLDDGAWEVSTENTASELKADLTTLLRFGDRVQISTE